MQISSTRLNTVRAALGLLTIWWLVFGIAGIFFTQQIFEAIFKEPFTAGLHTIGMEQGAMTLAWAVAFAIALWDPLRHRGLMQAIVFSLLVFFVVEIYVALAFGADWPQVPVWISNAGLIILPG